MDWLTAFWPIIQEPKVFQVWESWWDIKKDVTLHFRLFPGKCNDRIFQKIQKTLFWSHFRCFLPKFEQKLVFMEKKICQFLGSLAIYLHAKNWMFKSDQKLSVTHTLHYILYKVFVFSHICPENFVWTLNVIININFKLFWTL